MSNAEMLGVTSGVLFLSCAVVAGLLGSAAGAAFGVLCALVVGGYGLQSRH